MTTTRERKKRLQFIPSFFIAVFHIILFIIKLYTIFPKKNWRTLFVFPKWVHFACVTLHSCFVSFRKILLHTNSLYRSTLSTSILLRRSFSPSLHEWTYVTFVQIFYLRIFQLSVFYEMNEMSATTKKQPHVCASNFEKKKTKKEQCKCKVNIKMKWF